MLNIKVYYFIFFFVLAVFGDVQVKNPVFDWDNYLKETSSSAAPTYCFKQVKKK